MFSRTLKVSFLPHGSIIFAYSRVQFHSGPFTSREIRGSHELQSPRFGASLAGNNHSIAQFQGAQSGIGGQTEGAAGGGRSVGFVQVL